MAKDAKANGTDSPVLRRTLGLVYQAKANFPQAVAQYRLALELQPTDREVHQWLLACYDQTGDSASAIQQILAQIDFDRHNLALYADLANRTKNNPALAERAATSIVESAPNEAESHQALAKFREEQNRWTDAIPHWERVAELRKLEPTGLLGLATAQVHEKQWAAAQTTLRTLRSKPWPAHFGKVDEQALALEKLLP